METATADPGLEQDTTQIEDPEPQEPDPGELAIGGSGQLSFAVGGRKPTTSKLTVRGGAIEIDGQFEKAERVAILIEVEVRDGDRGRLHAEAGRPHRRRRARRLRP